MSTFESKVTIPKPIGEVYNFLADMNNHQQLMPENIQDWVSTYDTASFNIQNMAKLSLVVDSREINTEIKIIPSEKPPFNLELKWSLSSKNDQTEILFTIFADLNMMLKMLASGPLQKLADHETSTLVSIFSKT
ncbi:SRPBCC family protein [Mucilaginibacter sp. BJC16-A38]|uniref:SRPBCC family protein n=1 Tax=Mucilaginibacter phenanthrenivorans TaxID=1234842 RepID=UPI00215776E8|nr:SRPBCC family protein [Mucilaginibacter phenanthrenivorans]MCR8560057.1 SRPBCC family protein [Mucilaginibacter phenanthrenivorans]